MKIAVGASSFAAGSDKPLKLLEEKGATVTLNPYKRRMTEAEIIKHLEDADGLLAGLEPLNENVFAACPKLKAVARIGIGMDSVDTDAAKRHGIKVSNTPDAPTDAVTEMTLTALLTLNRRIIAANEGVKNGRWQKSLGKSISGQTVLIVGYGHIGRKVAAVLKSLGANILVYDKYAPNVSTCSLEDGLQKADAVTLHVSGNDEVMGKRELALLRQGAIVLNSARGGVINEDALYDGLKSGRIGGFWGDALWQEPYHGKICKCANAILTPHICTYTKECRERMETEAVNNLLRDLGI